MTEDNLLFYEKRKLTGQISVLGVPLDLGKDFSGTNLGPDSFRKNGLQEMFKQAGLVYKDLGNIHCLDRIQAEMGDIKMKYLDEILRVSEESAKIVHNEIKQDHKMLVLGGDHAIAIGDISGASVACEGDLGVIWIDAHGDMMTDENSLSGNIHGMPSSALIGFGHEKLVNVLSPGTKIKKENILYIGLKDLDQGEIDLIKSEKLHAFTIMDITRNGFEPVMEAIMNLQKRVSNIWISLDLDCIESAYVPGNHMATPGGLSHREIENLAKFIGRKCNVIGLDVVELAPEIDEDNKTVKLAIELIAGFFGHDYNWYTTYMEEEAKKQTERSYKS